MKTGQEFFEAAGSTLKKGKVEVRGLSVAVREMTAKDRRDFLELLHSEGGSYKGPGFLATRCALNDEGKPLFDKEYGDDSSIDSVPPEILDAISIKVLELSGMDDDQDAENSESAEKKG